MAKNEAKIKFTAETSGMNAEIKKSNDEMSKLRAELKLNETQMKATGATVEGLEDKHKILQAQLSASESKTEALRQKVEKAAEMFGENSTEVTKLQVQLVNAQTAEEKLRQSISACEAELSDQRSAATQTETATDKLTDTISKQEEELNDLKRAYSDAVLEYGKNSKEAKGLGKEIDSLSSELKDNKDELERAENAADKFDNSLDEAGEGAEGFNGKMAAVAVGIAAAGAALVEFGKSAIEAFNEVDEGADNVIKATGATGEQAEALEASYGNVAKQVVGDFGEIGSALGEVNTRFGYTGQELEDATIKFQQFSEITGVNSTEAVQAVSRALNDAGIPLDEYDTLLDQLAKAGQSAGIDVTSLANSLSENGSIMRSMGFNTQETIAMLSQFELSGANTSVMLGGMKKAMSTWADAGKDGSSEFANMVEGIQNGSVTAADAIDVFGTKAGPMLVEAIQSGKFEYQDMLATIEGSQGTVESTFDGTVDGGYEMELAMQNCKLALAEVGEVVGTALTPVFQALSETILPAMVDGFGMIVDGVKNAVSWMKEHQGIVIAVASVVGILTTAITAYNVVQGIKTAMDAAQVTTVWGLVAAHWAQAAAAMAAMAPYILIVAAIAAVIAIIVLCVKYWDEIVAAVKKCWEKIMETLSKWGEWINTNVIQPIVNFFKGIWDGIVNVFTSIGDWIKENWQSILLFIINPFAGVFNYLYENFEGFRTFVDNFVANIKQFFVNLWEGTKETWTKIVDAIKNAWEKVKNAVSNAINAVKNTVTNIWNGIKNTTTSVWTGIKDGVSNAINAVKTTVSNVFNGIKSTVTNIWNGIKTAISNPIEAAKEKVRSVIDAIKGFFNFKFSWPKIPMPHFGITPKGWKIGDLLKGSIPKLNIDWYAEGGILTRPTIFGINGNRLMAGGEAGAEAILPIDRLEGYISNAIEKSSQNANLLALADSISRLADRPIEMSINGRQFALATAGDGDSVNGLRSSFKSRGLAL